MFKCQCLDGFLIVIGLVEKVLVGHQAGKLSPNIVYIDVKIGELYRPHQLAPDLCNASLLL